MRPSRSVRSVPSYARALARNLPVSSTKGTYSEVFGCEIAIGVIASQTVVYEASKEKDHRMS